MAKFVHKESSSCPTPFGPVWSYSSVQALADSMKLQSMDTCTNSHQTPNCFFVFSACIRDHHWKMWEWLAWGLLSQAFPVWTVWPTLHLPKNSSPSLVEVLWHTKLRVWYLWICYLSDWLVQAPHEETCRIVSDCIINYLWMVNSGLFCRCVTCE